jgi:NAD(P)-dependent dehydrogenase (short-subunit alcohol dehydrogenase family)
MKSIVITGVSSGIGLACTKEFLSRGFMVFGTLRKAEEAESLREDLGPNFIPLIVDLRDHESIKRAADLVKEKLEGRTLNGLINNAGIARYGPLMHMPLEKLRDQYEVNVIGQLAVTQAMLPMMGASVNFEGDPGRILMMSSVSGKIAYPFLGPYASSKFALEAISDSLRRELQLFNIPVIILEPGRIKTSIWYKIDEEVIEQVRKTDYKGSIDLLSNTLVEAGRTGIEAEVLATKTYSIFIKKNPKARYSIVPNRFKNWILPRILPTKLIDRIIGKQLGLRR